MESVSLPVMICLGHDQPTSLKESVVGLFLQWDDDKVKEKVLGADNNLLCHDCSQRLDIVLVSTDKVECWRLEGWFAEIPPCLFW